MAELLALSAKGLRMSPTSSTLVRFFIPHPSSYKKGRSPALISKSDLLYLLLDGKAFFNEDSHLLPYKYIKFPRNIGRVVGDELGGIRLP